MAKRRVDSRKPITIYKWHKTTFVFTGKSEAAPDPFSHDKWLMPARSTVVAPPSEKKGYEIKMVDGKWKSEKA